eukprot:Blabericola_migrator_1__3638@NODE_208_length_11399_cov_361_320155_g179_i0_p1_GENE_NODE_208_length_11399_cov_361_320155_g179_i0NODE_208_length_11399_cov_361_320155_g179_i0_p1_ORF_typecomplete_len2709_score643_44KAP/PF05804_12/0_0098KAP/PF05804_12/84KAP/PF05804_12/3_5e02KAP/PF05804_12/0_94KAP/PF05804_12/5_2e02KAP/PF05804_12/0_043KAP/PF05804_12/0_00018Arm_2/PF04826_13/1_6Arm_2/PF04826_13/1_6e02Arm_2/PF04826_13/9_9e02Arm_2/PF04826_13/1_2e03Arm_2/PF04826_13/73Arm_2/PF04826_13/0_07Arm_2/PF04826_13/6_6
MSSSPAHMSPRPSKPARRKQRRADPSLDSTLQSISTNIDFKRMLVFGLRTLSQLSSSSNRQLVDNVFSSIEKGVLPMLQTIAEKHADDAEVINLLVKTLNGFMRALVQEQDDEIRSICRDSNLSGLLRSVFDQALRITSDANSSLWDPLSCILKDANRLDYPVVSEPAVQESVLTQCRTAPRHWPKAECLLAACVSLCNNLIQDLDRQAALGAFFTLVSGVVTTKLDKTQVDGLEQAIGASLVLVDETASQKLMTQCIDLLDATQSHKPLHAALSKVLSKMVTSKQVDEAVKKISQGGEGLYSSLDLLRAFSLVPECGEKWAQSGGIPLLNEVIKSVQIDDRSKAALGAAFKMIHTLTSTPDYAKQFIKLGSAQHLLTLGTQLEGELLGEALMCLNNLGRYDANVLSQLGSSKLMETIAKADLQKPSSSAVLELLKSTLSQKQPQAQVVALLLQNKFDERLAAKLKSGKCSAADFENAYQIFKALASGASNETQVAWLEAIGDSFRMLNNKDVTAAIAGLDLLNSIDPATFKKCGISTSLLSLSLTFCGDSGILTQTRRLLEHTATENDVKVAVQNLQKMSPHGKQQEKPILEAIATLTGLAGSERLRETLRETQAADVVLKAVDNLLASGHYSSQQKLIAACLDSLGTLYDAVPPNSCTDVCVSLMNTVNSSGLKLVLASQPDPEENTLLELLRAVQRVATYDIFEDSNSMGRVVEAVAVCMRKYPEHRRAQALCVEIMTTLLASKSADANPNFIQSGVAKQILSFLAKAAVQEDLQRLGLRLILVCAQRDPRNAEALRLAGAMEAVNAASRTHVGKTEIQKLATHLKRLLTPEDQIKAEVSVQLDMLKVAGRNRDLLTGKEALKQLAEMTMAAEGARHAAKNDAGSTVTDFFHAMKSGQVTPEEMELCSAGAAAVLTNIGTLGRPHSSILLKCNGLGLIHSILQDAFKAPQSSSSDELIVACLEAARTLLINEKNPYIAPGAPEFQAFLVQSLPSVMASDTKLIPAASTAAVQVNDKLMNNRDFRNAWKQCVVSLKNSANESARVNNLKCLYQVFTRSTSQPIAALFAESGGCDLLLSMMETYAESEEETLLWTRKVLEKIVTHCDDSVVKMALAKRGGAAAACRAFGRSLGMCKDDAEAATTAINLLSHFTAKMDKAEMMNSGLLEMVETLVDSQAKDDGDLKVAVAHLLGNLGADELLSGYWRQVVELLSNRPKNWRRELLDVLHKLEAFVPADCENEELAFSNAPAAIRKIAECMPEFKNDAEVLPALAGVCLQLETRFHKQPESPYGAQCMLPELLKAVTKLISERDPSSSTLQMRGFMTASYKLLTGFVTIENSHVYEVTKAHVMNTKFLDVSWRLLDRYLKDVETTTAILTFLCYFPHDEPSCRYVDDARDAAPAYLQKQKAKQVADAAVTTIWRVRRAPECVATSIRGLANILTRTRNLDEFLEGESYSKLTEVASASPEATAAYGHLLKTQCYRDDALETKYDSFFEDGLSMLIRQWLKIKDDESVSDKQRTAVLRELGGVAEAYAKRGRRAMCVKMDVPNLLADGLKQHCNDKGVVAQLAATFREFADLEDQQDLIVTRVCPTLLVEAGDLVSSDVDVAESTLRLTVKVLEESAQGRSFLRDVNGLRETLENITVMAQEQPPAVGKMLLDLINQIRRLLQDIKAEALTLEEVYRRWRIRKDGGMEIDASELLLANEYEFVINATGDYSTKELMVMNDPSTREFTFGCLCFGLLHENSKNVKLVAERNCHEYFMKTLSREVHVEVKQHIINLALPALAEPKAKAAWSGVPKAAELAVELTTELHEGRTVMGDRKEAFLSKRLEFMEKLCPIRTFYNGTDALKILIKIWDDVDSDAYTLDILKQVARVLRCLVNEYWADEFLKLKIPRRLLSRIENPESPYDLHVDILFCLGSMACVVAIKTAIGQEQGVEKIVDLLKRCDRVPNKTPDVSKTQQNACLTLGALVMLHGPNANAFGAARGIDLAIKILRNSMIGRCDYDVANAASVLMTNLSFQRDDFKELLGKKGAPSALLLTIRNYDGVDSESANRCMITMFKGIQNLALLPQNTQRFLAEDVSGNLATFYNKSDSLPDSVVLHSLKTLSNLTLENTDVFMTEFGQLMPQLLSILEKGNRSDPEMLSFLFDTFASLCRHEENRKLFIQSRGVEIVLKYLNSIRSEIVYEQGLVLLAVLACDPVAVDCMIHANIFSFVLSLLDDSETLNTEVVIAGLKVMRRLVKDKGASDAFIDASPMPLIVDVICAAAVQANTDVPSSTIVCDCLRILLQLLHLHPAEYSTEPDRNSEVNTDPNWRSQLSFGSSSRSRSFSRLFHTRSSRMTDSDAEPPTRATTEGETSSNEGSPVALDSPSCPSTGTPRSGPVYKPRGPRAYEKIGLDACSAVRICKALYESLISQDAESLKLQRLTDFSMAYIAYVVSEKLDGCVLPFTEDLPALGDFVYKIYGQMKELNSEEKRRLVFEGTELLCNLMCMLTPAQIKAVSSNEAAMTAMKTCASTLTQRREPNLKRKVEELWALLQHDSLQPDLFFPLQTYDFPVATADFSKDMYPNGVQDLNAPIKKKIRKGGKCHFVHTPDGGTPELQPMLWKSSPDLTVLSLYTDKRSTNTEVRIPVSRLRVIDRGLTGTPLVRQLAKQMKLWAGSTCSLAAGPAPGLPDGAEVILVFPTRFHCRRFYYRLREWQCAATV